MNRYGQLKSILDLEENNEQLFEDSSENNNEDDEDDEEEEEDEEDEDVGESCDTKGNIFVLVVSQNIFNETHTLQLSL